GENLQFPCTALRRGQLECDGRLVGERDDQRQLIVLERRRGRRAEGDEHTGDLVARTERNSESGAELGGDLGGESEREPVGAQGARKSGVEGRRRGGEGRARA